MFKRTNRDEEWDQAEPERAPNSLLGKVESGLLMTADAALANLQRQLKARVYQIGDLTVPVKPVRGITARLVVVKPDEIHIVTGHGRSSWTILPPKLGGMNPETKIFGIAAVPTPETQSQVTGRSVYFQNDETQVVILKTINFMVPVAGITAGDEQSIGVEVLDSENVSYRVTAFVTAKLDVENALVASQSVASGDVMGLAATIREVTENTIREAAAKIKLEEVIRDRNVLAQKARDVVNQTLSDLGYKLIFISIAEISGPAYDLITKQALAFITQTTTVETNKAEVETAGSKASRERVTAEQAATTRKVTEETKLAADQAIAEASLAKDETVAKSTHTLALANQVRALAIAEKVHGVRLQEIDLSRARDLAASVAEIEVAKKRQQSAEELALQKTQAEAARLDIDQQKTLARSANASAAKIQILDSEAAADATRKKNVTVVAAESDAEALRITSEADAAVLKNKAKAEAEAAEDLANAQIKKAEATRHERAAGGLAEADVAERNVEIATKQVAVDRAKGLAAAEVLSAQAEAEIKRAQGLLDVKLREQKELAILLKDNPDLLALRKLEMENAQALSVLQIQTEAQVKIASAFAGNTKLDLRVFGDGGNIGHIMSQLMTISHATNLVGQEVPVVGALLGQNGKGSDGSLPPFLAIFPALLPYVKNALKSVEPTMFSTLTVRELLEATTPLMKGEANLMETVGAIQKAANFRMIANLPVAPFLALLGLSPEVQEKPDGKVDAAIAVTEPV